MRQFTKCPIVVLTLVWVSTGTLFAEESAPRGADPADQVSLSESLRPLFAIAKRDDKSAPELIDNQIKTLASRLGHDPRLHYLHGLVLLKNFRHAEAIAAMQAGTNDKIYYFPIHRVLCYEQIRQKKYEEAIESLIDLSSRIGEPGQLWTSEVDRLEAARWLGRMVVYLSGPCGDSTAASLMNQAEPVIRSHLSPVYLAELDKGATELHGEHRALQLQLLASVENSEVKKATLLKESQQKQQAFETQKKEITTSARQQTAVQQEQIQELDTELKSLEKQYEQLQRAHDQLLEAIAVLRVQIETTPVLATVGSSDGATLGVASAAGLQSFAGLMNNGIGTNAGAKAIKEAELLGYILELNQNTQKQKGILSSAESRLAQRQQLIGQLRIGDKQQHNTAADLQRWQRRLSLSQKKVNVEAARGAVAIKARIAQFSTYESIQPQAEISRLELALGNEPE